MTDCECESRPVKKMFLLMNYSIDGVNLVPIYSHIGKTLATLFQYLFALGYYQRSLDIKLKHLPSLTDSRALTYRKISFVYKDMKNIEQILQNLSSSTQ